MRNMKFQEKQPLSQFLIDFENIILEIKNAGGALEESEVIVQLLSAMSESFHGVVTAIDVLFIYKRMLETIVGTIKKGENNVMLLKNTLLL